MAKAPPPPENLVPPPEATTRLVGHAAAEATFLKAFESGRMPHAWLLSGPRGIGKATLAFRMARFLLAHGMAAPAAEPAGMGLFGDAPASPPDLTPRDLDIDPGHPIFNRVRELSHSDLRVLRRTVNDKTGKLRSEIIVDDVRSAIDFLHLMPAESAWRVLIVDAADDLNRNAANALLKILEEPRPRSVLILVSHAPGRLLPTIRSRCRRLLLEPLPPALLEAELRQHCPNLAGAERDLALALAEGSLGRAITLGRDQAARDLFQSMAQLLGTFPDFDPAALHRLGDRLAGKAGEENFATAVTLLDWWLARFVRRAAARDRPFSELFPGESSLIDRLAGSASLDRWLQSWEKIGRLFARVASANLDRKQAWVTAWLVLASTRD
ncbi:DNA polymerase III delta prime subunit [Dongia mobilis]|uniref:DNA polymerase III delta prime subunit n=1 Tax=Dongia mobilis TaxID=578943 RepID=A0A4R6WLC9_9PROT|nr:DNA polymerase III subunit delta' [Dongia mobilis]TDQ81505.1 DNA polymerase III delta prime subunit [Dongia mobilis]